MCMPAVGSQPFHPERELNLNVIAIGGYINIDHKTLDEMLEEWDGADKFIIVMDTLFEKILEE